MPFGISYSYLQVCPTASNPHRFMHRSPKQPSCSAVRQTRDRHTDREAAQPWSHGLTHTSAPALCPRDGNHSSRPGPELTPCQHRGHQAAGNGVPGTPGESQHSPGCLWLPGGQGAPEKSNSFSLPLQLVQLFFFSVFAFCCNISNLRVYGCRADFQPGSLQHHLIMRTQLCPRTQHQELCLGHSNSPLSNTPCPLNSMIFIFKPSLVPTSTKRKI